MPPDNTVGSPTPLAVIAVNTLIIPITVPSSPINGVMDAMVPKVFKYLPSLCTTCLPDSSNASRIASGPYSRLSSPAAKTVPSGEWSRTTSIFSGVILLDLASSNICCFRLAGATCFVLSVKMRSKMMVRATNEQRRIIHMSGPPARNNSNIEYLLTHLRVVCLPYRTSRLNRFNNFSIRPKVQALLNVFILLMKFYQTMRPIG